MQIPKLLKMLLELRRPSGGRGVQTALNIIENTIKEAGYVSTRDADDNIICTTAFTGVLFSSHTDTVHWDDGINDIRVDDFGIITAWTKGKGKARRDVLGADDAAGIFIMLQMIKHDIGGTYVFHADEEIGCVGSRILADSMYSVDGYDLYEDFTHAIAFDRKGTTDFVWSQLGQQMCSTKCAQALMKRLNASGRHGYTLAKGIVTDTAMYADYVEECINLSVGYYDEHTDDERLDMSFLLQLIETIVSDPDMFTDLPAVRILEVYDDDEDDHKEYTVVQPETIAHLCHTHPDAIAELMENTFGYDYSELFSVLNEAELI